jgi:hypothetical protein
VVDVGLLVVDAGIGIVKELVHLALCCFVKLDAGLDGQILRANHATATKRVGRIQ